MIYPKTKKVDVVDTLHGVPVPDPYRWLEDRDDPATKTWIARQNGLTRGLLDGLPGRTELERRLRESLSIGSVTAPEVKGERYFFTKREGAQNQPVIYCRDGLAGEARVLIDPNTQSAGGLVSVDWWFPSHDGRYLAYGLSREGSELSTLRVLDVDSGLILDDSIPRTRGSSVAWLPDNSGFFYMRFPGAGDVPAGEEYYHCRIRLHRLGSDPSGDPVVFGEGRDMRDWLTCAISDDGRFLVVQALRGSTTTELFLRDLNRRDARFAALYGGTESHFHGRIYGDSLYVLTDFGAPNYRIFKAPASEPAQSNWREIVPEGRSKLQFANMIGGSLFLGYVENASSRLYEHDGDGNLVTEIDLPRIGTVTNVSGRWDRRTCFIEFTSFLQPQTVYRYDMDTKEIGIFARVPSCFDASAYAVQQVWYSSKDGTSIPMFIVSRKHMDHDGSTPTILYGYGGFNLSVTPFFLNDFIPWLEAGGIVAVANIRGGGEFGEDWHRGGMLENKHNSFDDFAAAAEWLFGEGYTSPRRLAILGASNGGLLAGALITRRPDICVAAVCSVPLLDMLRYHLFSVGRYWMTEYGDPGRPDHFAFLYGYSPYHNVRDGSAYPAVLLATAESDSRVDPLHALKMAARLQEASTSGRPVLLRYETKAGHGAGAPLEKRIGEITDVLSFIAWQLGVDLARNSEFPCIR